MNKQFFMREPCVLLQRLPKVQWGLIWGLFGHYLGTICPHEASEAEPVSFLDQLSALKQKIVREPLQNDN